MRRKSVVLIIFTLCFLITVQGFADDKPKIKSVCLKGRTLKLANDEKGGISPFLQSCIFGPRIGLEANEGKPVTVLEVVNAFVLPGLPIIIPIKAFFKNGLKGFLGAGCIGPRVGMQMDTRKIRDIEWLMVIPIIDLYARFTTGWEAYKGRTMMEIIAEENLNR
ncbi:hypothetical protein ACFL4T_02025 [candidate division KSB1 bacterium]